jgi:hypothetical protein
MTDLLDIAVKAHGRLDRWDKVNAIKVAASITGAIWYVKGKGDVLKNVVVTAETHHERVTVDFPGQDKRAVFEPGRIVIERVDKTPIAVRDDPEKSFDGQEQETPWDDIDVAYFTGEALWTYLNTPFLIYPCRLHDRGDPLDSSRGRDLAPVEGDIPEEREEPLTGADLLLWT